MFAPLPRGAAAAAECRPRGVPRDAARPRAPSAARGRRAAAGHRLRFSRRLPPAPRRSRAPTPRAGSRVVCMRSSPPYLFGSTRGRHVAMPHTCRHVAEPSTARRALAKTWATCCQVAVTWSISFSRCLQCVVHTHCHASRHPVFLTAQSIADHIIHTLDMCLSFLGSFWSIPVYFSPRADFTHDSAVDSAQPSRLLLQ